MPNNLMLAMLSGILSASMLLATESDSTECVTDHLRYQQVGQTKTLVLGLPLVW